MTLPASVFLGLRYTVIPDQPAADLSRRLAHPAALEWTADRPYEVLLHFPDPANTTWYLGWDLLNTGLTRPSGVGDVHISPAPGQRLQILLRSPNGHITIHFSAVEVRMFVAAVTDTWQPADIDDEELVAWIAGASP